MSDGSAATTAAGTAPASAPTRLPAARAVPYGDHPLHVANLHLPAEGGADDAGPWPCVVLLHGGFWRSGWDRTLMTPLAHDLAGRGLAVWNVEYRGTGRDGGGWPETLLDVAAAFDRLASVEQVDAERVVACGHSAGGHLALWSACRPSLPPASILGGAELLPRAVVALAPVCALVRGARDGLGDGAVQALLEAEPDEAPERYALASPAALLPVAADVVLVHGSADDVVPPEQSRALAEAARHAGGRVELVELPGVDHFDVIHGTHPAWATARDRLLAHATGREEDR